MVSSNVQSKKISQHLRQSCKKFFEDFYTKEEQAGRHPHPLEAQAALGRIFNRITEEGEWPPQPPDRPAVPTEVWGRVISRFSQEAYDEAVAAWGRHTPGLEIEKGKPGRPLDNKAPEYFEQHSAESSYTDIAKLELQSEPEGEAKALLIQKESERIRASVRRSRRRQSS
jgi:hypothetical protein